MHSDTLHTHTHARAHTQTHTHTHTHTNHTNIRIIPSRETMKRITMPQCKASYLLSYIFILHLSHVHNYIVYVDQTRYYRNIGKCKIAIHCSYTSTRLSRAYVCHSSKYEYRNFPFNIITYHHDVLFCLQGFTL